MTSLISVKKEWCIHRFYFLDLPTGPVLKWMAKWMVLIIIQRACCKAQHWFQQARVTPLQRLKILLKKLASIELIAKSDKHPIRKVSQSLNLNHQPKEKKERRFYQLTEITKRTLILFRVTIQEARRPLPPPRIPQEESAPIVKPMDHEPIPKEKTYKHLEQIVAIRGSLELVKLSRSESRKRSGQGKIKKPYHHSNRKTRRRTKWIWKIKRILGLKTTSG